MAADLKGERSAFGTYAPNRFQRFVIAMTRALPDNWGGRRLAFALRRLVTTGLRHPLDVEVFGQRMRLMPFNNVAEKRVLFMPQYFDARERDYLARAAGDGFIFIDVGANIGAYTMFVAGLKLKNARLFAIEPQPDLFERLTYNISLNRGQPVKAMACALSGEDGEMTLFLHPGNKGQSSLRIVDWEAEHGESLQVPTKTLLTLAHEEGLERIDAIKIDVEGAEDMILVPFFRDAPESLWPKTIILEEARQRWQTDCIALCQKLGYRLEAETRMNVILARD